MKRLLLLLLPFSWQSGNAQCPVTVNGQPSGASYNICAGTSLTFTAGGATNYTWSPLGSAQGTLTLTPSATGSYTLYGSNGTCLDSNIFTVNVSPNPAVTASAMGSPMCAGSTCTLTAMGASTYTWSPATGLSAMTGGSVVSSITSSLVYSVTGSDMNGCQGTTTVAVQVNPSPSVSFSLTNSSPQVWDAVAVYSGGTPAYTYNWNWGDGSPNDVIAYPSHTYSVAGWYNVCVTITDANACTANMCVYDSLYKMAGGSIITLNVTSGSTGIHPAEVHEGSLYPNPASQSLFITSAYATVEIYDLTGKLVLSRVLNGKTELNISPLPEGMYIISLKGAQGLVSRKLVIAR